ncbi:MAG: sulfatase, partial [Planctomycetes bacterium]|nr:sulfatase [Planctomycetota bacterium]
MSALGRGAAGLAILGGLRQALGLPPSQKPNIVFILVDDLGWSDLGCYGNRFHETPHIDRLAQEGMRFTDAYAACPVCSPTRASILSGQYPARLGLTDFISGHWRPWEKLRVPINRQQYLPLESVTIAEALNPAGYISGMFGKWHLGGQNHYPDQQGFDSMLLYHGKHFRFRTTPPMKVDKNEYLADVLTDRSERFLEKNKDRPFFLYLSHYAVHIPLQAKRELIEKYQAKPKPNKGVNNPTYAAMVEHVDTSVGRVLKKLDELDLSKNTIVIFFSDNGGLRQNFRKTGPIVTTNAPLRDEKGTLYEGGIREPLIVRWPGVVRPGSTCDEPVTSVDFYPTFLEITQAQKDRDHTLDGKSITALLKQSGSLDREAIYWHYPHYHHSSPAGAIRAGSWKLIEFYEDGRLELYN